MVASGRSAPTLSSSRPHWWSWQPFHPLGRTQKGARKKQLATSLAPPPSSPCPCWAQLPVPSPSRPFGDHRAACAAARVCREAVGQESRPIHVNLQVDQVDDRRLEVVANATAGGPAACSRHNPFPSPVWQGTTAAAGAAPALAQKFSCTYVGELAVVVC